MKLRNELLQQIELLEGKLEYIQLEYVGNLLDTYGNKLAGLKLVNVLIPADIEVEYELICNRYTTQLRLFADIIIQKSTKFNNSNLVESIL